MNYGIKLKDLRDLYELTQEDVAKVLKIARSMLMSIPKCTKKGIYLCTKRGMKLYT